MSWKTKKWNDKKLRSEDFVEAIEAEFESFMENGDVTPNELKERVMELATGLADWVDEAEDLENARLVENKELKDRLVENKITTGVIIVRKGSAKEVMKDIENAMKEEKRRSMEGAY